MKLHGTTTSPYVRRVRIVAAELGIPHEFSSIASPAGQAALRALTPIWKVPVAEIDGQVVFDSHVIIEHLLRKHGRGPLRPPGPGAAGWAREQNLISVADAALDAALNVRALGLEGTEASRVPYLAKQRDRAASCLGWLAGELRGNWLTDEPRLGLAEIALITALDWFAFRNCYPGERPAAFSDFLAAHADRPSVRSTPPAE